MINVMISKTDLHVFIIALAVVLIPFDDIAGISILGGLGHTASIYPIIIGMMIWLIGCKGMIRVPVFFTYKLLAVFYFFAILSIVINIDEIRLYHFQGQIGFVRAIVQLGALGIILLIPVYLYNVLYQYKGNVYKFFYRYLMYSFFLAGVYSFFEVLTFLNIEQADKYKLVLDGFFRSDGTGEYGLRLRSVCLESSTFGEYFAVIVPWVVYKAGKSKVYLGLLFYLVLLCLLSLSRTTYIVLLMQFILCFAFYGKEYKKFIFKISTIILLLSTLLYSQTSDYFGEKSFDVVVTSVIDSDGTAFDLSNIARYASQEAAIGMFKDSPIYGVGYGMYGFLAQDYYPQYAWKSLEIVENSTNFETSDTWPPVHSWIMRILGEIGAFGIISWLLIILSVIYYMYKLKENIHINSDKNYVISGIISFIGCFVVEFKGDTVYNLSLWFLMSLPFISINKYVLNEKSNIYKKVIS